MDNVKLKRIRKIIAAIVLLMVSLSGNCQSINSMMDFKKSDNLKIVRIISYIHDSTDCGEWGGHTEEITISKRNDITWIHYTRKANDCDLSDATPKKKTKIQTEYDGALTKTKQECVKKYLRKLTKHIPNKGRSDYRTVSNAPNIYEIKFQDLCLTYSFRINDEDNSWNRYELFRNQIIK